MPQRLYLHEPEMEGRPEVLEYVANLKKNNPDNFTLIDIGASWNHFSAEFLTHTFDLAPLDIPNVHHFSGDINDYESWQPIFDYVEQNGKFDFCNCTHTLEDIAYPQAALRYIPRIAKQGFISVPSKYSELQRRQYFRGSHHHRWIFVDNNNQILLYPKINLIEYMIPYQEIEDIINEYAHLELRVFWSEDIDFHVANYDYLGPTFEDVVNLYHGLVSIDLERKSQ